MPSPGLFTRGSGQRQRLAVPVIRRTREASSGSHGSAVRLGAHDRRREERRRGSRPAWLDRVRGSGRLTEGTSVTVTSGTVTERSVHSLLIEETGGHAPCCWRRRQLFAEVGVDASGLIHAPQSVEFTSQPGDTRRFRRKGCRSAGMRCTIASPRRGSGTPLVDGVLDRLGRIQSSGTGEPDSPARWDSPAPGPTPRRIPARARDTRLRRSRCWGTGACRAEPDHLRDGLTEHLLAGLLRRVGLPPQRLAS